MFKFRKDKDDKGPDLTENELMDRIVKQEVKVNDKLLFHGDNQGNARLINYNDNLEDEYDSIEGLKLNMAYMKGYVAGMRAINKRKISYR